MALKPVSSALALYLLDPSSMMQLHQDARNETRLGFLHGSSGIQPGARTPFRRLREISRAAVNIVKGTCLEGWDVHLGDWIEIVHGSTIPVDLAGWSCADHPVDPGEWIFPALSTGPA